MKRIQRVDLSHPDPTRDKGVLYMVDLSWWATPIISPLLKIWVRIDRWQNKNIHIWGK